MQAHQTTKSASSSTAPLDIVCTDFKHHAKNTVIGICTLDFPQVGLRVSGCRVHVTSDRRMWIGWPSEFQNGKWMPFVCPTSREAHYRLQAVATKAVRAHLDSLLVPAQPKPVQPSAKPAGPPKAEIPDMDIPI